MRLDKLLGSTLMTVTTLTLASSAQASPTSCANREAMLVGSTDNVSISAATTNYYATRLFAGRSYAFLVWTPFEDASEGGGTVALAVYSDTGCTTLATTTSVESEEPWGNIGAADIDAVSFIPSATGQYVLAITNGEARSVNHRVMIMESTIYSPWWYVGSPNQSFITITNQSNVANTAFVTIYSSSGTACATPSVSIPANGNTFIRVNDYAACVTATYGAAQIAWVGTPGTIMANTTVINSIEGVSFDEPFVPRWQWGGTLTER